MKYKYIDADKLIAEIERRIELLKKLIRKNFFTDGSMDAYEGILILIKSLQQEQRNPNLENEIKAYTETLYHEIFGNGQGTLDEFDWEDITQVIDDTARYFYDLNKNDE